MSYDGRSSDGGRGDSPQLGQQAPRRDSHSAISNGSRKRPEPTAPVGPLSLLLSPCCGVKRHTLYSVSKGRDLQETTKDQGDEKAAQEKQLLSDSRVN